VERRGLSSRLGAVLTAACPHPTALRGGASRAQDPPPHRPGGDGGLRGAHDHCPDAAGEWGELRGRVGWGEVLCDAPCCGGLEEEVAWLERRKDASSER